MVLLSFCLLVAVAMIDGETSAPPAGNEGNVRIDLNRIKQEYELIMPISTDAEGRHVSNILSNGHRKRLPRDTTPSRQPLYFNVTAFGREFHLKLKPNTRLIAPGAVVEWHEDLVNAENRSHVGNTAHLSNNTKEIWKKEPLWTNCAYVGEITDIPGASVALSNCDGLAGMIRTTEDEYFIEPLEKGKQKEEEEGRIHVIYKRSTAKKVMPEDVPNRSANDIDHTIDR